MYSRRSLDGMGVSEIVVNGGIGNTRTWVMTYDRMIMLEHTYIVSFVRNLIGHLISFFTHRICVHMVVL